LPPLHSKKVQYLNLKVYWLYMLLLHMYIIQKKVCHQGIIYFT